MQYPPTQVCQSTLKSCKFDKHTYTHSLTHKPIYDMSFPSRQGLCIIISIHSVFDIIPRNFKVLKNINKGMNALLGLYVHKDKTFCNDYEKQGFQNLYCFILMCIILLYYCFDERALPLRYTCNF